MHMDRALCNLICFIQMFNKNNPRQTPYRGGSKRGQWIRMGVSASGDVQQAEKIEVWLQAFDLA